MVAQPFIADPGSRFPEAVIIRLSIDEGRDMRKTLSAAVRFALSGLLAACMPSGMVKNRLDMIEDSASCPQRATTLVVLLPGVYDTPQDLVREGFVAALRQRRLNADIVVADAHLGYYYADLIITRLHEDIVLPAVRKGYRQIWLAGISLGGYGALHYSRLHGDLVTGMFLMAPYPGDASVLREIAAAGGPAGWQAGNAGGDGPQQRDRELWTWIKEYRHGIAANGTARPRLYIGYGTADRFAPSNRMMAKVVPPSQVFTTEGGHDWQPWLRLWDRFLDLGALPAC
jgi:hypothetical protein